MTTSAAASDANQAHDEGTPEKLSRVQADAMVLTLLEATLEEVPGTDADPPEPDNDVARDGVAA